MTRCSSLAGVLLLALTGCFSDRPDLDFGDVHGRVTLNGQPLSDATVRFQPESGRASFGQTDANGEYALAFMGEPWGAIVGSHSVAITTENMIEDPVTGQSKFIREYLPPKYHAATTLSAQVEPGENEINFELVDSKKRK